MRLRRSFQSLGRDAQATFLLLGEPLLVAGFDEFGERRERSLLGIDGVADEGDQVREGFDGVGGEGALFEVFVGFPDFGGSDVVGRPGDGFGEGFEFFVNEVPFRVGRL